MFCIQTTQRNGTGRWQPRTSQCFSFLAEVCKTNKIKKEICLKVVFSFFFFSRKHFKRKDERKKNGANFGETLVSKKYSVCCFICLYAMFVLLCLYKLWTDVQTDGETWINMALTLWNHQTRRGRGGDKKFMKVAVLNHKNE